MTNLFHGDRVGKTGFFFFYQLSPFSPHYFCFTNYELGKLPVPLLDLSDSSFGCSCWTLLSKSFPARSLPPLPFSPSLFHLVSFFPSASLSPLTFQCFWRQVPTAWLRMALDTRSYYPGFFCCHYNITYWGFPGRHVCYVHRYIRPSIFLENNVFLAITFSFAIQLLPLITC